MTFMKSYLQKRYKVKLAQTFEPVFLWFYNLTVDFRSNQLSFNGKVELMLSTVFYDLNRLNLEVMWVLNL